MIITIICSKYPYFQTCLIRKLKAFFFLNETFRNQVVNDKFGDLKRHKNTSFLNISNWSTPNYERDQSGDLVCNSAVPGSPVQCVCNLALREQTLQIFPNFAQFLGGPKIMCHSGSKCSILLNVSKYRNCSCVSFIIIYIHI